MSDKAPEELPQLPDTAPLSQIYEVHKFFEHNDKIPPLVIAVNNRPNPNAPELPLSLQFSEVDAGDLTGLHIILNYPDHVATIALLLFPKGEDPQTSPVTINFPELDLETPTGIPIKRSRLGLNSFDPKVDGVFIDFTASSPQLINASFSPKPLERINALASSS